MFVNLIDPTARKEVIMAALTHDLGELMLGDIPAPTKRAITRESKAALDTIESNALNTYGLNYPDLLTPLEHVLLKFADCFDGLSFCTEEVRRGNMTLKSVGDQYVIYLSDYLGSRADQGPDPIPWWRAAQEIFTTLETRWRNAT